MRDGVREEIRTPGGWKPVPKDYFPRPGDVVRYGPGRVFRVGAGEPDRNGVRWVTYTSVEGRADGR